MNILGFMYSTERRAYEIYVAGCHGNPHCEGCHSPTTWAFDQGDIYENYLMPMFREISMFDSMIDHIMIMGGEPLDQKISDLATLLRWARENFPSKKLWVFTHYELSDACKIMPSLPQLCDFLKCGRYMPKLATEGNVQFGITLATSNQYIVDCKGERRP